jgi:hypothetical protein
LADERVTFPSSNSIHSGGRAGALGPRLPMAAYHALERWSPERVRALALYCSDGRWGEAFDEFCHRHLQLPRYDRWAVPGGPGWVAGCTEDSGVLRVTRNQLDFLVQTHEIERVVLITHYGCAWYSQRVRRPAEECLEYQSGDVRVAADVLRGWYPGLRVDAYLAMRAQEWVSFHALETAGARGRDDSFAVDRR